MTLNRCDIWKRRSLPAVLGTGRRVFALAVCSIVAFIGYLSGHPAFSTTGAKSVLAVDVKGVIGVATSMHVCGALTKARAETTELVVIKLDTPGGILTSTREVIQCILSSAIPVAVYVSPSGARAASAGTYITFAAHIAAMAPGTHLGAATPVAIGNPIGPQNPADPKKSDKEAPTSTALERKTVNDAVAYLQSLAQLRGRNAEWAEKAVRDAATLTAEDAAREKVVDFLAGDLKELLGKIDGRSVTIAGTERRISTLDRAVVTIDPDWRTRVLAAIADPNIAFMLLMVGVYGLLFEFWSPGAFVPGVIGAIALLLGLTALSTLPVSYGGLMLVLLGLSLMVAEAFAPGFGVLGIGGVVAFVVGAIFLIDPAATDIDLRIAWPVIIGAALSSALVLSVILGFAIRARQRPAVTGAEEMIGLAGEVLSWDGAQGSVRIHGEIWEARGSEAIKPGARVRVVSRDALTLTVEAI